MEYFAEVTTTRYEKKPNTKTVWVEIEKHTENITREHYDNIVTASPFFRRLGGHERIEKSYTSKGFLPTCVTSISPNKQNKTIRQFKVY